MKPPKEKRIYRKITSYEVGVFLGLKALEGNGTKAIRRLGLGYLAPHDRAFKLSRKAEEQDTGTFIDEKLQQIGVDAVNRVGELVNSTDEAIATKNAHYTIDHIRGQATKKQVTLHGKFNIQNVLD